MEVVFATNNKDKMVEIRAFFKDTDIDVLSLKDLDLSIEVVEDGTTFEENAIKKASEIMKATGKTAMADDSGIEIDYLDKKPGVFSARYLGSDTPYIEKNTIILEKLQSVPKEKRTARFVCVIATCFPNGDTLTSKGVIEGYIHDRIEGTQGFGYDPIFYVEEFQTTTACMSLEQKNKISHRGKALAQMKERLRRYVNENTSI